MYPDIVEVRDFYASGLGMMARRLLRNRLRQFWPNVAGMTVVGAGFTTPLLRPFLDEADRIIAVMPAQQGVLHWPPEGPNVTCLAREWELPLPDASVDRLLIAHALENTEHLSPMLREAWRVMKPDGRMIVVAPNRRGVWTRIERTPFGHGRPFTNGQLDRLLRSALFTPEQRAPALFLPPLRWRLMVAAAPAWEEIGRRFFTPLSGVIVTEARKEIYSGVRQADHAQLAGRRPRLRILSKPTAARTNQPAPRQGSR